MKDKTARMMLLTVAQDYLAMAAMLQRATDLGEPFPNLPDTRL